MKLFFFIFSCLNIIVLYELYKKIDGGGNNIGGGLYGERDEVSFLPLQLYTVV